MTKQIAVVDQAGSVGYVAPSDRRGFELNPQAWTSMNSVRMDEGAVEPCFGYNGGDLILADDCHALTYTSSLDSSDNFYVIASDTSIDAYSVDPNPGGGLVKKNLGTGYTGYFETGDVWVTTLKDGHIIMTNGKDAPQMILRNDLANLDAVDLEGFTDQPSVPGQPAYTTCKTIIAFRGFIVAGNIGFNGAPSEPNMIAWSDRSDTGALPTTWDYSDLTTLSGHATMPGNYGAIIAMEEMRGDLMVYCERGTYRVQWTGDQYVFRISPAFDTVGAINPRATCSNKGRNIIVSYTDILISDGQYPDSIANGTVRKELFDQLGPTNSHLVEVIEYPAKSEVLIICPDKQDDKWCTKILAWNWNTNTWTVRRGLLLRTLSNVPKLVSTLDPDNETANSEYDDIWRWQEGITDSSVKPPADQVLPDPPADPIIEDTTGDYDKDQYELINDTFGSLMADEGVLYMFGIGAKPDADFPGTELENTNSIWQFDWHQHAYDFNSTVNHAPFVERRGINLTNDETTQIVTAIYPKIEGSGRLNVYVGAVDYIGGTNADIRWDPPVIFDPEENYRITCRVAGRRHAIKFEAIPETVNEEAPVRYQNFRLTGYDMEYSQTGRR